MAIADHVATLLYSSLDQARPNKNKVDKTTGTHPMEFYALVAFPPSAQNDLVELAQSRAAGGSLTGVAVGVKTNASTDKPIPGIPGDWLIVRAATQYAPQVLNRAGKTLERPADEATIKSGFYPGREVRVLISPFAWDYKGKKGISFNLDGIMDAGDGTRLNIGAEAQVANAFGKYADASAPDQTGKASNGQDNPFGNAVAGTATTAVVADGTVGAPTSNSNPFQQSAAGTGNPFG